MSKTTRSWPVRSTRLPVCCSLFRGRASRSARKSVRKASVAAGVKLARKRESAEREGSLTRREQGHEGLRKRQELLIELLQRAFAEDFVAEEHGKKIDDLVMP